MATDKTMQQLAIHAKCKAFIPDAVKVFTEVFLSKGFSVLPSLDFKNKSGNHLFFLVQEASIMFNMYNRIISPMMMLSWVIRGILTNPEFTNDSGIMEKIEVLKNKYPDIFAETTKHD